MDHFIKPVQTYTRKTNLIETYIQDNALHLHLMTQEPLERCVEFVKQSIQPGGRRALRIPQVGLLMRNKYGDRERKVMPLTMLLADIEQKREILSPSLTAYTPPDVRESSLAKYIVANLEKRSHAKKQMFEATMAGDKVLEAIHEAAQTTLKIKNNSLSGAQCSPYTILWNKTAHSTLTSTCRCATSYGNANNERFLMGNRHYWSPDITRNNIISIIAHSDLDRIRDTMTHYGLSYPTSTQVMALIERSTRPYWRSQRHLAEIEELVNTLNDVQRAAFLFTSNLYDLALINPEFVRGLLGQLSSKITEPLEDPEQVRTWMGQMDADLEAFVCMLCGDEMAGRSLKTVREEDPRTYGILAANVQRAAQVMAHYGQFIQTFWLTDHLPPSIYYLPSIIRKTVIVSDTDSTIFTVSYWADWYLGRQEYSPEAVAVANAVVYLAGQTVRHIMATLSGNMGVHQREIFRLAMKNEFFFPVFVLTGRAKHYFAYRSAQEGNVFDVPKMEIKGVGLRNSNVPVFLTQQSHALMRYLMDRVMANEKISLRRVLRKVAQIELGIIDSIKSGDFEVLRSMQIKTRESYKDTARYSNYDHYVLWESAFAPKYGNAPSPPYRAIKVPLNTTSPTRFKAWLDGMADRELAQRIQDFYQQRGRKDASQLLLPENILNDRGIPEEVMAVMDIRSTVAQLMEGFYIVLEGLGYYVRNDHNTRLAMDEEDLLSADWPYPEIELT